MSSIFNQNATSPKKRIKSQSVPSELKTNTSYVHKRHKRDKRSQTLKSIFTIHKDYKKKKRQTQSYKKKKRQTQSTKSKPNESPSISTKKRKILWKPSLQIIHKDDLLLNTLIKYMQKSFNAENISFLLCIKQLKSSTNDINSQIISMYNLYINRNSKYQINLSYHCFVNILSKRDKFNRFDIKQKQSMFDLCVTEIENLMCTSILPSFYRDPSFQSIAQKSKHYNNGNKENINTILDTSTDDDNDLNTLVEPVLIRNRRPSITCALYNSTTEVSKDIYL